MKLEVTFCELHTPLFMGGTNFGTKLDPTKRQGLVLTYDRDEKELIIEYKGIVSLVPSANAANMVLADPSAIGITAAQPKKIKVATPVTQVTHPMKTGIASAQVSTPHDHVFKTNQ